MPRPRTRTEIERANNFKAQVLQKFVQMVLPLSNRIIDVRLGLRIFKRRNHPALYDDIMTSCYKFDECISYYLSILSNEFYDLNGSELSQATRDVNKWVWQAENSLETLRNRSSVRRELIYDD